MATTKNQLEGLTMEQMMARILELEAQQKSGKKPVKTGTNMDMKVKGNILTITVDLSKEYGVSSSGKSIKVASSDGNIDVIGVDGIKIGLNVYKPVK